MADEENIMDIKIAKLRYNQQKAGAKSRGIEWLFTFETWREMWEKSGKWEQRGAGKGKYVMSRPGDKGPYSPDNVVIKTHSENVIEAHEIGSALKPPSRLGKKNGAKWHDAIKKINTLERAKKISDTLKAKYAAQGGSKTKGRVASLEEKERKSEATKLMWQKKRE